MTNDTIQSEHEQNTERVMLDIETLGLEPGCAILSIGAVRFDEDGLGETFHESISLESCGDAGLRFDAGTLEWWLEQDEDAQGVLTGGRELREVLFDLGVWYEPADEVWANSPVFDCAIVEHAYDCVDIKVPWEYHDRRDYRTLEALPVGVDSDDIPHDGVEHDALDDAKHQAKVASLALSRLGEFDGGGA